ncbi:MAG: dTDP-glucose 4,6-dehydratase [Maricaulis sp.]|uniref:dTDP-glucose 4,6-dehydratase n=1 Tax=Maricaulis sp. TaxID=1486257 RepID=UPI001B10657A|nr:dTDP-glucose 4,6-dehydratase [Maricaulis sp.]MBO6729722.1 dTDP-glucose 4,6-dehydratase [Maricaulis sp.]MBO6848412.1 dTDP-glucose 4,6-dehydratase [Maricaulis sp.]MBO6878216.1 dTDP-glucose 4,6-dehydratase [Maricaulis sp.]
MRILVTGGCGFIGSEIVRRGLDAGHDVANIDALTYSANPSNLERVEHSEHYHFSHTNICDAQGVRALIADFKPEAVIHAAAESHVDRSIDGPLEFVTTNVTGTAVMLSEVEAYWRQLPDADRERFRFLHISTDEVFGALGPEGAFTEDTPYAPNSPYSASKASSDMLVRSWFKTYGLPTLISNCSNNYGPYQFPEKLIPVVILNAIRGHDIPVYGRGKNVRDWLHVSDHVGAIFTMLATGRPGETYAVGGGTEVSNIDLVRQICTLLDELKPAKTRYSEQVKFVTDRPGHDFRYAIDASKIEAELGWTPAHDFRSGLRDTVVWYLENLDWCQAAVDKVGQAEKLERLGVRA